MSQPSNSPMPADQPQTPSQQQPPTTLAATTEAQSLAAPTVNYIQSTPITMKPQIFATTQMQQTPLALTTTTISQIQADQLSSTNQVAAVSKQQQPPPPPPQPQSSQPPPQQHISSSSSSSAPATAVTVTPAAPSTATQLSHQIQSKIQPVQLQQPNSSAINTQSVQPITLTAAPSATGPTALVIIPQHSAAAAAAAAAAKCPTKITPVTTTIGLSPTQVTLASSTQPTQPIQLPAPIAAHVSNITSIPLASHQQTGIQQTIAVSRASNLPVIPIATPVNVKSEPNKYICCLLDNGIRCDRVAGNASFSARIQKIVGNKKMNFALDPTVRHAYICEHHKAIITVAKKSATLTRDTKANAKNYATQNNSNIHSPHNLTTYNELPRQQQNLHHTMNVDYMNNQNRITNNHAGNLDIMPGMQGSHLPYAHYQNPHPNQVGSMDVMMSGGMENTGGDSIPSGSDGVEVDLQQLQVNTLRRYKRHFRVQTRPGLNKMQLAESLKSHFKTLPIIEKEAITYFVYIVKCYRNKLDHNPKAD